jgi:hypothetical protein
LHLLRNIQSPYFDVVKCHVNGVIGGNEGQQSLLITAGIGVEYSSIQSSSFVHIPKRNLAIWKRASLRFEPRNATDPTSYIDQILALWQMLNWDKWFNRLNTDDATASSPLQPFHFSTNVNDVYDSNRGRCWTDLNYDYDYFQLPSKPADGACGGAEGQYRTDLIAKINLDYGKTRKRILETKRTRPDFEGVDHDYIINIIYDRWASPLLACNLVLTVVLQICPQWSPIFDPLLHWGHPRRSEY